MIVVDVDIVCPKVPELTMRDWIAPAVEVSQFMHSSVLDNFRNGFGPGGKWPPLKKTGFTSHLLETGRLFASIVYETYMEGRDVVVSKVKSVGVPYAAVHNFGYPPKKIPERRFMAFHRIDLKTINDIWGKHIVKQLTGKR